MVKTNYLIELFVYLKDQLTGPYNILVVVRLRGEFCHDIKAMTGSPHGPEQIRVLIGGYNLDATICKYNLRAQSTLTVDCR